MEKMQSINLSLKVIKNEDCEILLKWISKKRIRFFLSSAFRQKNKFKYFKNDNKKIIQNGTLFGK